MRGVTRKVAEAELRRILAEVDRGEWHHQRSGTINFQTFVEQDFLPWKEGQVKHSTFRNYGPLLKTTILPTFGSRNLNQITPRMVDIWWSKHRAHPVNRRNAYFLLRGIFKAAVKWKLLAHSPVEVEGAGRDESTERPDWSVEDFDKVLAKVPEFYRAPLEVMFSGHLRLGELVALNGSDYRNGFITVTKQKTGQGLTTETKTRQHKSIQLLERGREALAARPAVIGDAPLFGGERAYRLPRHRLQRVWHEAVEDAGFENFHLHDLRHISLSLVADLTRNEKITQQRAGHASGTSTRRYMHTDKKMHADAVEAMDDLLRKRKSEDDKNAGEATS